MTISSAASSHTHNMHTRYTLIALRRHFCSILNPFFYNYIFAAIFIISTLPMSRSEDSAKSGRPAPISCHQAHKVCSCADAPICPFKVGSVLRLEHTEVQQSHTCSRQVQCSCYWPTWSDDLFSWSPFLNKAIDSMHR